MFLLSNNTLDPEEYIKELKDDSCGGYVSFEGWVRDFNEGKKVTHLKYEAYQVLAEKEAQQIIQEAIEKFDARKIKIVHRVGDLQISEIAVWIGATAVHRGEAFDACEYVIDQLKIRVPIWKKEYYVDGDSGWVECHECKKHIHD
ncbi:MAG: hypothetical protein COA79_04735 [Planctomycetota bacterium]|nr:MAG: hypothetical protein COA79_04735 [Planctomycetota bacterium]